MNNKCDVAVVGAAFMDLQVFPVSKTLLDTPSYQAQKMVWSVGGDAINESTILTRLGHRVRLVSCVGEDMIANMVIEHCDRNGIDTSCIKRDPSKTTSINIGLIGEDAERTFINNRSGSIWTFSPEDVDMDAISGAKLLSFASIFNSPLLDETVMLPLFEKAKAEGMIICADIVASKNHETIDDIRKALSYVDYFYPNYDEACKLTGKEDLDEVADTLLEIGVKNVVIKIGTRGCLVKNKTQRMIIPAYPKSNCIDTTGAGDNFASGFISGILEGRDLEDCARRANCTASIAVEAIGATEGVRSRAQVDERYEEYLQATGQ